MISNYLTSYSNQNSMVLAQKQTHKSREQNKKPRNEPTLITIAKIQKQPKCPSIDE